MDDVQKNLSPDLSGWVLISQCDGSGVKYQTRSLLSVR